MQKTTDFKDLTEKDQEFIYTRCGMALKHHLLLPREDVYN